MIIIGWNDETSGRQHACQPPSGAALAPTTIGVV